MKNWYETFSFSPKTVVAIGASDIPGGEEHAKFAGMKPIARTAVAAEVAKAEAKELTVRGIGSVWSSTDVMATGGIGMIAWGPRLLACAHQAKTWGNLAPVLAKALRSDDATKARRLVHVEASLTIHDTITALAKPETSGGSTRAAWCIPNMGASSGQTLVGAISTASHGGAFNRRPLADSVRAIRLVGPGGVDRWIEPSGAAAITDAAQAEKALPGVKVHYDDELFFAALVTVGSLGLITELVLEVSDMFGQAQSVVTTTWKKVRDALADGSLFTSTTALGAAPPKTLAGAAVTAIPEGMEIFINPYRSDDDYDHGGFDRECVLVARARVDGLAPEPVIFPEVPGGFGGGFGTWIHIETGGPAEFRGIINDIMGSSRATIGKYLPTPTVLDTYAGGGEKVPGLSLELAITTADNAHLAMMTDIFEAFDELIRDGKKYAGFFSMRFTLPSKALLAMQHVDDPDGSVRVCHLEVFALKELHWGHFQNDGNAEGGTEAFLRAFVAAADKRGARMHWGQLHHLDRQRVAADFAAHGLHAWRRARTRLSRTGSWRTFSNSFTRRVGLESYHEGITATSSAPGRVELFAYAGNHLRQLTIVDNDVGQWSTVKAEYDERIAAAVAATVTASGAIDVYAESNAFKLLRLRSSGGAWTATVFEPNQTSDGIVGPWAATTIGTTTHLMAPDRRGNLRWLRIDATDTITTETVTPALPASAGRFLSQLALCADGDGRLHVVGVGSRGWLLRGRRDGNGWTWGVIALKPPYSPAPESPPAVVATGKDRLAIFGVTAGQPYRVAGKVDDPLWSWALHPLPSTPTEWHSENVAVDRGGDDAYLVTEPQQRTFATACGPVAAVSRGGQLDLFARADTGAIVWSRRPTGQGWRPSIRLTPPG